VKVLASPGPDPSPNGNPYLRLLYRAVSEHGVVVTAYSRTALLGRPDVVHVHWPGFLVRWQRLPVALGDMVKTLALLRLARWRGAALVWTGHDLEPHDVSRPRLWTIFFKLFLSQVDTVISMGDGATDLLIRRYPQLSAVPVSVVPHGHYRDAYAAVADAAGSRQALGLDERPVFLVFGQIGAYKNIPALVQSWRQIPQPRPQLVIAGEPRHPEVAQAVRESAAEESDARLLLRLVGADEVPQIFGAADVVVLPYRVRSALNSGVAILGLSFGRPVVVSDSAANRDLQRVVGDTWVYLCDGTPEDALRAAQLASTIERPERPDLSALDWSRLGDLTVAAYENAIRTRKHKSRLLRARATT
jgi:beta-1,4-mannosyltransferase